MNCQMMRVISSPSSSTIGWATLIFFMTSWSRFVAADHSRADRAVASAHIPLPQESLPASQALGLSDELRPRRGFDRLHQLLDGGDDLVEIAVGGCGKALGDHVIDEAQQALPVAGDVDQEDGLVMQAELAPGEHLEGLIQRSEATGQNGECIGQ